MYNVWLPFVVIVVGSLNNVSTASPLYDLNPPTVIPVLNPPIHVCASLSPAIPFHVKDLTASIAPVSAFSTYKMYWVPFLNKPILNLTPILTALPALKSVVGFLPQSQLALTSSLATKPYVETPADKFDLIASK